jgi:transcriptional regulator with XRE-family HTH domain
MNRIRALRVARGITQAELANALNVYQAAVSQWERDVTGPDGEALAALSSYFGVPEGELLERTDKSEESE